VGASSERKSQTEKRIKGLQEQLRSAEKIVAGKACVYATGSYGRCEASNYSDLDLFILGKIKIEPDQATGGKREERLLTRLDEILVKAELIQTIRKLKIQEFSGDGKYLIHYSVSDLIGTLGKP